MICVSNSAALLLYGPVLVKNYNRLLYTVVAPTGQGWLSVVRLVRARLLVKEGGMAGRAPLASCEVMEDTSHG